MATKYVYFKTIHLPLLVNHTKHLVIKHKLICLEFCCFNRKILVARCIIIKKSQLILLKGVLTFSILDVISVKMEMSLISEKNIKSNIIYYRSSFIITSASIKTTILVSIMMFLQTLLTPTCTRLYMKGTDVQH